MLMFGMKLSIHLEISNHSLSQASYTLSKGKINLLALSTFGLKYPQVNLSFFYAFYIHIISGSGLVNFYVTLVPLLPASIMISILAFQISLMIPSGPSNTTFFFLLWKYPLLVPIFVL